MYDGGEVFLVDFGVGDECGYFLFFFYFLVDVFFDIRMVGVDYDYFGCMMGGVVGFDCICGLVVDFQEVY